MARNAATVALNPEQESAIEINAILLEPPGSRKRNQAQLQKEKLCVFHLLTGDMLRAEIAGGSKLGAHLKKVIDDGKFVFDDLVVDMIHSNLDKPE